MAGRPILPPGRVSPSLLKAHNLIFASQTALPAGRPILPPGRVSPSLLKAHNLIFASQTALPAAKRLRPARIKLNETGERASASDNERAEASGRASGSDNVLIAEKVDVACPAEAVSIKGASEQDDVGDFGASSQSTDQASKPLVSFKVMAPLATERVGLADRIRKAAASIDDQPICDHKFLLEHEAQISKENYVYYWDSDDDDDDVVWRGGLYLQQLPYCVLPYGAFELEKAAMLDEDLLSTVDRAYRNDFAREYGCSDWPYKHPPMEHAEFVDFCKSRGIDIHT